MTPHRRMCVAWQLDSVRQRFIDTRQQVSCCWRHGEMRRRQTAPRFVSIRFRSSVHHRSSRADFVFAFILLRLSREPIAPRFLAVSGTTLVNCGVPVVQLGRSEFKTRALRPKIGRLHSMKRLRSVSRETLPVVTIVPQGGSTELVPRDPCDERCKRNKFRSTTVAGSHRYNWAASVSRETLPVGRSCLLRPVVLVVRYC